MFFLKFFAQWGAHQSVFDMRGGIEMSKSRFSSLHRYAGGEFHLVYKRKD